ncbi:MAG: formate dehydrogenase accessory protein FdhE [Deltaproteobacteria bacterium]|nr:formate dehydrogenase accessory protein FdhE [Deltaproteobacteria bacterium]
MDNRKMVTADRIKQAVAAVKAARPAYGEMLHFYERLFLAQEAAREKLTLPLIEISEELLSVKREEGFPIINKAEFSIDFEGSVALMREICQLSMEANETLAGASPKIVEALDKDTLDANALFSKILIDDEAYFDEVSKALGVDKTILAFLGYSSMRPSLTLCAEQLASYLDKGKLWQRGYCPVCGSTPALSVFREEGARSLVCGFCSHEWKTTRVYCPFCDNRDQKTLNYFFSEEEKDYRVDVCDQCKKYVKTVDTREMKHPFYPLVEQVSTLHLDLLAQEQGLESGNPIWLQM